VVFGARLRAVRQDRGWTIRKLAADSGVHYTYLGYMERGERNPTLLTILRLAEALGIDAAVLLKGIRSGAGTAKEPREFTAESR
jgi:transcriptional regulator with XRE-family HTH domain